MDKTEFAGLTRLDPADSLAQDGFSFQAINPVIIDFLLRIALTAHKHDAHDPMANPATDPVVDTLDAGGTIPSDTTLTVGYTLIDTDGGESAINAVPQVVTTQAGLETPTDAPTLVADNDAGTLLAGNYSYAVTVTDAGGGETALGPAATVVLPSGPAANEIEVSGLDDIVTAAGGTGWRLWRSVNGDQWSLINDGVTPSVMDDGSLCADRGFDPPDSTEGTTNATSQLQVTVPAAGQPPEAVQYRIYASEDGTFSSPSLLGTYPVAEFDDLKTYPDFEPLDGAPPATSLAVPGAPKINAATDLVGMKWQAPVADAAALDAVVGMTAGDVRLQLDDLSLHAFNGATWEDVGGSGGGSGSMVLSPYLWADGLAYPAGSVVMDTVGVYLAMGDIAAPAYGPGVAKDGGDGGGFILPFRRITGADHAPHNSYNENLTPNDPHPADAPAWRGRVYEFEPFANGNSTITADIDFKVYDAAGTLLATGDSSGPEIIATLANAHYYILIFGDGDAYQGFTVSLAHTAATYDIDHQHPKDTPFQWMPIAPNTSDWTAGVVQGAWVASAAPHSVPAARYEELEYNKRRVTLRGSVNGGAVGAAWDIPDINGLDLTPSFRQFFTYGTAKLSVRVDGKVYVDVIGAEVDIPLDGISYFVN